MRYVTAVIGAIFIFIAIIAVGFGITAFLPAGLLRPITLPLGPFSLSGTPSLLIALAIAPLAAIHSFRSTLKRYNEKARANQPTRPDQIDPPPEVC